MHHEFFALILSARKAFEQDPEGSLNFALRSVEAGMDLEKQFVIDRRGFEINGVESCEKCPPPGQVPKSCKHGFDPVFQELSGNCSCVTGYKCCGDKCQPLKNDCEKGTHFPQLIRDCCNCQKYVCRPCPVVDRKCLNPCDEPVDTKDERGCPSFECVRKPDPTYPIEDCNKTCQVEKTVTDKCGFHKTVCECQKPPQCTPEKPKAKDCHRIEKVNFEGAFGCAEDEKSCVQCYYWIQVPDEIKNKPKNCSECQLPELVRGKCGGYTTECRCRDIPNCHPPVPPKHRVPRCHTPKKVFSETTFKCNGTGPVCVPCYHWDMVPDGKDNNTVNCDTRCMYKRPKALECGAGEECVCNGRTSEDCQPNAPDPMKCYTWVKNFQKNQFMCNGGDVEKECLECWKWGWKKDPCPAPDNKTCSDCEQEVIRVDECGCRKRSCEGVVLKDCKPKKPPVDKCHNDPVRYPTGEISASENGCINCHRWNVTRKHVPDTNKCHLEHLPKKCRSDFTEKGECGSTVTSCRRNVLPCANIYDECPVGHKLVELKTECGGARSACVDCGAIVEDDAKQEYPNKCYTIDKITIMGQCVHQIKKKKQCKEESLHGCECPRRGMKKKLFHDKCGCPKLICVGCSIERGAIDVQVLLDSSYSIKAENWDLLMNEMKEHFIDSLMTHKDSRMAIARFGTDSEELIPLKKGVTGKLLDPFNNWRNMDSTYLGEALHKFLPKFKKVAGPVGTGSTKFLFVITDGKANGHVDVKPAAAKWKDAVDHIYALGFAEIDKDGLGQITDKKDNIKYHLNLLDLIKDINENVLPTVCNEEGKITSLAVDTD